MAQSSINQFAFNLPDYQPGYTDECEDYRVACGVDLPYTQLTKLTRDRQTRQA